MTGMLRFSWLAEQGAPSRAGVRVPAAGGFEMFCIEKILPRCFLGPKSIKIMPEIYKNNQKISMILELHFLENVIQCSLPRKNYWRYLTMYAINPELCTFCKKCMEECPSGAITEGSVDGKEVCVVNADCIDCGGCEDACETEPQRQSATRSNFYPPTERKDERTGGRFGTLVFYREKVEPWFFSTGRPWNLALSGGGRGPVLVEIFSRLCYNL